VAFLEASVELSAEGLVRMEIGVARAPLGEVRRSFRFATRGNEQPVLRLVPVHGRLVHVVPRELVEDEQRSETGELVERRVERLDVMEDAAGDDGLERTGIIKLLECDPAVEGSLGCIGIDREHLIAGSRERGGGAALVAAANLEHPHRRRR